MLADDDLNDEKLDRSVFPLPLFPPAPHQDSLKRTAVTFQHPTDHNTRPNVNLDPDKESNKIDGDSSDSCSEKDEECFSDDYSSDPDPSDEESTLGNTQVTSFMTGCAPEQNTSGRYSGSASQRTKRGYDQQNKSGDTNSRNTKKHRGSGNGKRISGTDSGSEEGSSENDDSSEPEYYETGKKPALKMACPCGRKSLAEGERMDPCVIKRKTFTKLSRLK